VPANTEYVPALHAMHAVFPDDIYAYVPGLHVVHAVTPDEYHDSEDVPAASKEHKKRRVLAYALVWHSKSSYHGGSNLKDAAVLLDETVCSSSKLEWPQICWSSRSFDKRCEKDQYSSSCEVTVWRSRIVKY
jgi:hypothetical protein